MDLWKLVNWSSALPICVVKVFCVLLWSCCGEGPGALRETVCAGCSKSVMCLAAVFNFASGTGLVCRG